MKLGARTILILLIVLAGSPGCVRYVERTTCPATCSGGNPCGLREVDRYSSRWPIASAVAAAVLLGAGGIIAHEGQAEMDALENDIDQTVSMQGTRPFDWDSSREDKALFLQNVGSALIGAGVITLVTAAVLYFYQKKPIAVSITPVEPRQSSRGQAPVWPGVGTRLMTPDEAPVGE